MQCNVWYVSDSRLYMVIACVYLCRQCISLVASVNWVSLQILFRKFVTICIHVCVCDPPCIIIV